MYDNTFAQSHVSVVRIDNRCQLIESNLEQMQHTAIAFGFTVKNLRLYPLSTNHRLRWRRCVQQVFESKEPQYAVVRDQPELVCALLSVDQNEDVVQVYMSKRQICRSETANRVGDLLGFTKREKEVVLLLSKGCSVNEVALVLGTKLSTVRSQIKSIMMKSGIPGVKKFLIFLSCLPEPSERSYSHTQFQYSDLQTISNG